jgi:hypothetical protein
VKERDWTWIIKYNEDRYRKFEGLALNSPDSKVPDMYDYSLPSVYLKKPES